MHDELWTVKHRQFWNRHLLQVLPPQQESAEKIETRSGSRAWRVICQLSVRSLSEEWRLKGHERLKSFEEVESWALA